MSEEREAALRLEYGIPAPRQGEHPAARQAVTLRNHVRTPPSGGLAVHTEDLIVAAADTCDAHAALIANANRLVAALAAATAREEELKRRLAAAEHGLVGKVAARMKWHDMTSSEELVMYLEERDALLRESEAEHTERVVRWCYANPPMEMPPSFPFGHEMETPERYLARALAAAKGGQDG